MNDWLFFGIVCLLVCLTAIVMGFVRAYRRDRRPPDDLLDSFYGDS